MSATDRLDEIQQRADKATEGQWEARHRADLDWLSRSPAVDSDGHEPGSSVGLADAVDPLWGSLWPSRNANADAEFIAHARTDVPALVAALRAVLDLHAPLPVYELRDEFGGFATDEDGERKLVTTLCRECSSEDAIDSVEDQEWTEDWAPEVQHPCPTVRTITAALGEGS